MKSWGCLPEEALAVGKAGVSVLLAILSLIKKAGSLRELPLFAGPQNLLSWGRGAGRANRDASLAKRTASSEEPGMILHRAPNDCKTFFS